MKLGQAPQVRANEQNRQEDRDVGQRKARHHLLQEDISSNGHPEEQHAYQAPDERMPQGCWEPGRRERLLAKPLQKRLPTAPERQQSSLEERGFIGWSRGQRRFAASGRVNGVLRRNIHSKSHGV